MATHKCPVIVLPFLLIAVTLGSNALIFADARRLFEVSVPNLPAAETEVPDSPEQEVPASLNVPDVPEPEVPETPEFPEGYPTLQDVAELLPSFLAYLPHLAESFLPKFP